MTFATSSCPWPWGLLSGHRSWRRSFCPGTCGFHNFGATETDHSRAACTGSLPVCGPAGLAGCPQWGDLRIPEDVHDVETEVPFAGAPGPGRASHWSSVVVPQFRAPSQAPRRRARLRRGLGFRLSEGARGQADRRGRHCGCTGGAQARSRICRIFCASWYRCPPCSG